MKFFFLMWNTCYAQYHLVVICRAIASRGPVVPGHPISRLAHRLLHIYCILKTWHNLLGFGPPAATSYPGDGPGVMWRIVDGE